MLPVRPKPQITSSASSSTSCFFRTFWIFSKYVAGGTITPPAPITGSANMAATVSGPSASIIWSSSSARRVAKSSSLSPSSAWK
jgi:hypothetical protein